MRHCTVCGAEAREGAKFCTSCGARLDDAPPAPAPADTGTDLAETSTTVPASAERENVPVNVNEATMYTAPGAGTGTEPEDAATTQPADAEPVEAAAPVTGDPYVASWPSETEESSEQPAEAVPAAEDVPAAAETTAEDDDHHGASTWESWAPVAYGDSTVPSDDDSLHGIRELVDQLKHRLDRLANPVSLRERGVDPDDLAEDLHGWTDDTPDTEEILAAIRSVRESPENVTALLRLASYADDLERIIDQYGAMTSSAERWVDRLRNQP